MASTETLKEIDGVELTILDGIKSIIKRGRSASGTKRRLQKWLRENGCTIEQLEVTFLYGCYLHASFIGQINNRRASFSVF